MKKLPVRTETATRSVVKSIVFRVIVVLTDLVVISYITGEFLHSIQILVFTNIASTILYYLHERVWDRIHLSSMPGTNKHHTRALFKTVTSRVLIVMSDFLVTNRIISSAASSLAVIVATNTVTTVTYYLHEKAWHKVAWGKIIKK